MTEEKKEGTRPIIVMNGAVATLDPKVASALAAFEADKKAIDEKEDEIKTAIKAAMIKNGVLSISTNTISISYIAPGDTLTLDSKKLKADQPDVWNKYSKKGHRSDSVKITIKDAKAEAKGGTEKAAEATKTASPDFKF